MERLFETAIALAENGRAFANGMPKPLDLALFAREFEREVQAAFPPPWLQRIALAPLAWLAERRGHAARYPAEQGSRKTPCVNPWAAVRCSRAAEDADGIRV
jgi:hypothetical protein